MAPADRLLTVHVQARDGCVNARATNDDVLEYVEEISSKSVSGTMWDPPNIWNKFHGDGKSRHKSKSGVVGALRSETQKSTNSKNYLAKIIEKRNKHEKVVVKDGLKGADPAVKDMIDAFKGKYGKKN